MPNRPESTLPSEMQPCLEPVSPSQAADVPGALAPAPINAVAAQLPDAKTLLEAANSTSEKVSTLHLAFMALCAYVLVIVFSTTDMDLLIGKGIKLPIVDVEVPITGFYALVPFLVVLAHFNLLLQLQLLSRKLFAFDEAASKESPPAGLHDQLHTFPFNYYLIGKPSPLIKILVSVLVTTTILLLPLLTLLTIQTRFLAYQDEPITWSQRIAIWLDVATLIMLWPVILDRFDNWRRYMAGTWQHIRVHWVSWLWGLLGITLLMFTLTSAELAPDRYPTDPYRVAEQTDVFQSQKEDSFARKTWTDIRDMLLAPWAAITGLALLLRPTLQRLSPGRYGTIQAVSQVGLQGLVAITLLGIPLPILLTLDGEAIDHQSFLMTRAAYFVRHLDVHEGRIFAKPAKPEILADLRSEDAAKRTAAMNAIEPVDLRNRNLRYANFSRAILSQADLRESDLKGADLYVANLQGATLSGSSLQGVDLRHASLQGADLSKASLEGANLSGASLQGADLFRARLQGADMFGASLQGANLIAASLQGSNLFAARLEGADLSVASLQGADLSEASLEGANLSRASLQGADLSEVRLQGATISDAKLQGAKLTNARIYSASFSRTDTTVVHAEGVVWQLLSAEEVEKLKRAASKWHWHFERGKSIYLEAIEKASSPGLKSPTLDSCLRNKETQIQCQKALSFDEYNAKLLVLLEPIACADSDVVRGLLRRGYGVNFRAGDTHMRGFASRLEEKRNAKDPEKSCP